VSGMRNGIVGLWFVWFRCGSGGRRGLGEALTSPDPNQVPRSVPRDQPYGVAALCQDVPQPLSGSSQAAGL